MAGEPSCRNVVGTSAQNVGPERVGEVSKATVSRLPSVRDALVSLAESGVNVVSSEHLARLVGETASTVRRDLAAVGIAGTRGVGYDVRAVLDEIGGVLGVDAEQSIVIVGAGNLGTALANYPGFSIRGFFIRAIVDRDPAKIGTSLSGLVVRSIDELQDVVEEWNIRTGIIATPAAGAQQVANQLVNAGVLSILSFSPTSLDVAEEVAVRRVDIAAELQILSYYRTKRRL